MWSSNTCNNSIPVTTEQGLENVCVWVAGQGVGGGVLLTNLNLKRRFMA